MGTENKAREIERGEAKPYGLMWRVALFLFIAGPASVFAFGIYARIGIRTSLAAGVERGDYMPSMILVMWLFGMVSTAIMIFKR